MAATSILGLVAFLAIFALAAWGLRRLQRHVNTSPGRQSSRSLRVLARYPLGWQCMLMIVDVAGKHYAITVSRRGEVTLLGEAPVTVDDPPTQNAGFAALLRRTLSQHGKQP